MRTCLIKMAVANQRIYPSIATSDLKPPRPNRRRPTLCRCFWTLVSLLLIILVIIGVTAGILYLVFHPKLPNYSVDNIRILDLTLNFDLSLYASFNVRITAYNPNEKIGIYYRKGSCLSVWYRTTKLCQGSIPSFYQGHRNKTVLDVGLAGQNQYGRTLLQTLQEQQQMGRVPLDLKINVPVNVKLGTLKLRKVRISGTCMLVVDTINTNTFITIKVSNCKFGINL